MSEFSFSNTLDCFSFFSSNKPLVTKENAFQQNISVDEIYDVSVDDSAFLKENLSLSKVDPSIASKNISNHNKKDLNCSISSKHLSCTNPNNLSLKTWGLPDTVLQKYKCRGITNMFEWQMQCLSNKRLLERNTNLVYSAPTSAGKTLVAEILAIKTVLERRKKVLFILPFISVVREKMFYFQDILSSTGVRVEGYMGSHNPPGGFQAVQIAICTIEKANSIINRLLEDSALDTIGTVVIDELHLLGDPSRGYLLELMLTKLKYMSTRFDNVNIQIIGMSATLPNLDLLGKWLKAEMYQTDFRPIPLYEQCLVGRDIYNDNLCLDRTLPVLPDLEVDSDNILQLCLETVENSCSVLIFCPTKNWCESLAQQISQAFWKLGNSGNELGLMLRQQLKSDLINETLEQLKRSPAGLDKILHKTVSFGVAFHHAGLTMDERDIIEAAFRKNILRVLIATSTLSSGVNLPARRVIIRTPMFYGKPLDNLVYRQMIGRAGRMGRDICGESILICQKNDFTIAKGLLSNELNSIESCLEGAGKLKRAILEVIASGVAITPDDVNLFTACTLLAVEDEQEALVNPIDEAMDFLCRNEFIRLQKVEDGSLKYIPTSLGKACLSSSMPPEEGLALFAEIEKARECFVLETELHLIYLVTPYSVCNQWSNLDWMLFLELWEKLSPSMKRVGELVGVRESYIINGTRNKVQANTTKLYQKQLVHRRFFTALALQDLVNEIALNDVATKFGCARGMLQSLQQSASTFAGMLTTFCRQLGWSTIEILVSQFQDRLQFGISRDLLDLMRLPALNGQRARALYNGGVETVAQLASSEYSVIENILHKVIPFESEKERDGENGLDAYKRNKIKGFWVTGKEGMTEAEAAVMLVEDARKHLQLELGLTEAKWGQSPTLDESLKVSDSSNAIANISEHDEVACTSVITSDQSLFEESFELHEQLASCAISNKDETSQQVSPSKPQSNNDSGLEFENVSLLEEAFVQSFDLQDKSNELIAASQIEVSSVIDSFASNLNKSNKRNRSININIETPTKRCKLQSNVIDFNQVHVVDVCTNAQLFETFCSEICEQSRIALSFACIKNTENTPVIGNNIIQKPISELKQFCYKSKHVFGVAITWGSNIAYFLSFEDESVVQNSTKINLIQELFINKKLCTRMFDCKEQLKTAKLCCDLVFNSSCEDPKVSDWLLDPEGKEKNLQAMALKYAPEVINISQLSGNCKGVGSVGLDLHSNVEPYLRAAAEVIVSWHVCESITKILVKQDCTLLQTYGIEMSTLLVLTQMELNGFGVDNMELQLLATKLEELSVSLEKKCYSLVGYRFSLTSSKDVARALGTYKGRKVRTNKKALEQIDKPLAWLILQWRKLNNTLTKMIYPLIRVVENGRIHGYSIMHSATGRISMHEPNLQNIPRNFIFEGDENFLISCRDAFIPTAKRVFLSADYCQLELRLLAHFSQDKLLVEVMRSGKDVFKSVAAKWKNIPELQVDDTLRQRAKQLCYGIIYGIGPKALAEQLEVTEDEAINFSVSFHNCYAKIQTFIANTIHKCRELGYVETQAKRRRYFSHITDTNQALRSQAERQAVNTTIQGSAADLAKTAMVLIDARFQDKFKHLENLPKLVLHLHDELLYEVQEKYLVKTAKILKNTMEGAIKLSIPFPVKVKAGKSWGKMTELAL